MELITDRTEADVLLGTAKGQYNYTDLNRVESAVGELVALAARMGVGQDIVTKTDWAPPGAYLYSEWPTAGANMIRYLQNVSDLCDAFQVPTSALPYSMSSLTWEGANAIEKALQAVYQRIQKLLLYYRYSGEFYAGEETTI